MERECVWDALNGVRREGCLVNTDYIKVDTKSEVDTFDRAAIYRWLGKDGGPDQGNGEG